MGKKYGGIEVSVSESPKFSYKAFLSYSHAADGKLAPKLQSALHMFAKPWYRLRAMRVFRDETSLSNTPELWPTIEAALSQSEYFLLLASPESAKSLWVKKEIEYWINNRSKDKLLIILTKGELKWANDAQGFDWIGTTALPKDLKYPFEDEPRYTDFRNVKSAGELSKRNPAFSSSIADVASTLLGRDKDELIGEDVRRHRQTKRITMAAIIVLLILTVTSIFAAYVAVKNQNEAERKSLQAESRQFALESERSRYANNIELPLLLALEAVHSYDTFEARRALLEALKNNPVQTTLEPDPGFSASGGGLAFSPNGNLLATSGNTYPVVLWDIRERRSLERALMGEMGPVSTIDFSPNGQMVAAGDKDGVVLVWNVDSRQQIGRLFTHQEGVLSVAFSPDNQFIATSSCAEYKSGMCQSGEIRLWDLTSFEQIDSPLIGHEGWTQTLAFSPNGDLLVSGGSDGTILIWDFATRQILGKPLKSDIGKVHTLSFSADGMVLAAINGNGMYRSWHVNTWLPLDGPNNLFRDPFISLFGGRPDKTSRLSNFLFGDAAPLSESLGNSIWAAHDTLLATTNKKGAVVLISPSPSEFPILGTSGINFRDPYSGSWQMQPYSISPDRKTIAMLERNGSGNVSLWEIGVAEPFLSVQTNLKSANINKKNFVPKLAFSQDGKYLAITGCTEFESLTNPPWRGYEPKCTKGHVRVWEIQSQHQLVTEPFSDHESAILTAVFSPDGTTLISYGVDGSRVVRNLTTGIVLKQPPVYPNLQLGVYAVSPDENRVAAAEISDSTHIRILLWKNAQAKVAKPQMWTRKSRVYSLAFNPVDKALALGGGGGQIDLWDPESQQPFVPLFFPEGGTYEVSSLAFSPDGRLLAFDADLGIIVLDLESRQWLLEERNTEGVPLFFSLDGNTLIAGSERIDLSLESWKQRACEIVNRNFDWNEWNLFRGDQEYRNTCDSIALAPTDLADYAKFLAEEGQIEKSKEILTQAVTLAYDRGPLVNSKICELGGIMGFGEVVLSSCEQAVKLCEKSWICAENLGQRGVARALAGDLEGAAEDLQAYVDSLTKRAAKAFKEKIEVRQEWIRQLKAGQNPFDAATLYELRTE